MGRTKIYNNRGTRFSIPIQFHASSSKLYWQTVQENGITLLAGSWFYSPVTMEHLDLGDGWELVRRYLSVKSTDEKSILEFLIESGHFGAPEGSITSPNVESVSRIWSLPIIDRDGKPVAKPKVYISESFSTREFAMIQDYVRRMLITANPTLPTPWRVGYPNRPYEIAFGDSRSGSQAHVLVTGTYRSILATVQFKLAQGSKFKICARKDCRLPFEITSRHTRRFCTQYCAHITSLRQRRRVERTSKTTKAGVTNRNSRTARIK
jgi:hypothetical protein